MVYDEGFEIKIGTESLFAFSKYRNVNNPVKIVFSFQKMTMMNRQKGIKVSAIKLSLDGSMTLQCLSGDATTESSNRRYWKMR